MSRWYRGWHIRYLLDKHFEPAKAFFYILQTIEHGWSRNMLLNMISTDLYESQGSKTNNFPATLPAVESDYAREIIKDPYHFDFLTLTTKRKTCSTLWRKTYHVS